MMKKFCSKCTHGQDIGFCDKCLFTIAMRKDGLPPTEYEEEPRPQTNADRLRAGTDEEIAVTILKHKCESCDWVGFCKTWDECKADLVKWLRQKVEPGAKL